MAIAQLVSLLFFFFSFVVSLIKQSVCLVPLCREDNTLAAMVRGKTQRQSPSHKLKLPKPTDRLAGQPTRIPPVLFLFFVPLILLIKCGLYDANGRDSV